MDSSQEDLYEVCCGMAMTDLFSGFNCTIFAYGRTGTGKSWSMFGSKTEIQFRGLIPRCVETMFTTITDPNGMLEGKNITISVGYVEIYQEKLTDLLNPG